MSLLIDSKLVALKCADNCKNNDVVPDSLPDQQFVGKYKFVQLVKSHPCGHQFVTLKFLISNRSWIDVPTSTN